MDLVKLVPTRMRLFFVPPLASRVLKQQAGGAVLSFEVKGGRAAAWRVIDSTRLISITANLGDVKTTITHPATTTHGRISAEARAAARIKSEHVAKVIDVGVAYREDVDQALEIMRRVAEEMRQWL